jgi:hypothetical protein
MIETGVIREAMVETGVIREAMVETASFCVLLSCSLTSF